VNTRIQILTPDQVSAKIRRIACEIMEKNYPVKELILLGIDAKGNCLSSEIASEINKQKEWKASSYTIIPDACLPNMTSMRLQGLDLTQLENKIVILVDDVLYSGKTMYHALKEVMKGNPAGVQIAVLIDRGHRSFPLHANYTGLELGTTLQEHIKVEIETPQVVNAYLFS
jgi:pyrimidine operon attenuation protein/uracil phosphoribosyltransferase